MSETRRSDGLWLAVVLATGCSSAGGRADAMTSFDDSFTGGSATATDGLGGTSSPTGPGPDDADGGGLKLDVGAAFDLGGGAVPPSCDNIHEFPSTSVGCEFYAVQVPSFPSPLPYGISVGNPGNQTAHVVIEDMRGPNGALRTVVAFDLDPQSSVLTEINGQGGILAGESHMVIPSGLNERAAFRVSSDAPVTAMQIFPVGGGPSHVSEASLLLPVNSLDTSYIAVGYPQYGGGDGFVIVVAIEDATTARLWSFEAPPMNLFQTEGESVDSVDLATLCSLSRQTRAASAGRVRVGSDLIAVEAAIQCLPPVA